MVPKKSTISRRQGERRSFTLAGSLLGTVLVDAAVAQLVEHVIRNDGVGGSSPFSGTTFFSNTL